MIGWSDWKDARAYDLFARRIPRLSAILTRSAKDPARIFCMTLRR